MNAQPLYRALPRYPAGRTRTWDGIQIAQCPRGQKHISEKANCKDLTMETLESGHGSGQAALGGPMPCSRRARWPPEVPFDLSNSVVILHDHILGKHQYSFNKLACCWMVRNNLIHYVVSCACVVISSLLSLLLTVDTFKGKLVVKSLHITLFNWVCCLFWNTKF